MSAQLSSPPDLVIRSAIGIATCRALPVLAVAAALRLDPPARFGPVLAATAVRAVLLARWLGRRRVRPDMGPGDAVKEVSARSGAGGWASCVVVNERGIVLGRLRLDRIDEALRTAVEDVMEPGPATVRADAEVRQSHRRAAGAARG